jgi:hypothetical protein
VKKVEEMEMENQSRCEVAPDQYTTVVRQMLRHEDDVTNQRLMWLLVVQGLLVNAYIPVRNAPEAANGICLAGILVTLSAFASLYKSYQARGYLKFLGAQAKKGILPEEYLRFDGWPVQRLHGWRGEVWACPWLERFSDLLDPYLTLPALIMAAWLFFLFNRMVPWPAAGIAGTAVVVSIVALALFCVLWTRIQGMDKAEPQKDEVARKHAA